MTHTYVTLDVPQEFFDLVKERMEAAGYDHAIHVRMPEDEVRIDMHGIALVAEDKASEKVVSSMSTFDLVDGEKLDQLGQVYGIPRQRNEAEREYRNRIAETLKNLRRPV